MDVIITDWAFQSYLDLKHKKVFTSSEYKNTLRPDAERLKNGYPNSDPKFSQSNFWGPCSDRSGHVIRDGFKMKWRQIGPGRVQLRLMVAIHQGDAYLCDSFVKSSDQVDKRFMAKMKNRIRDINLGNFTMRGQL